MATLFEQLDAMLTLKPNWDGYNSDPIQPGPVAFAKEFVTLLLAMGQSGRPEDGFSVNPCRDGGVQVEWVDESAEHELEINPDGSLGFLHVDKATGKMTTREFRPSQPGVPPGFVSELSTLVAA